VQCGCRNEEIWKLHKSCISNPKSEVFNRITSRWVNSVQSDISDFGFEMQDSSNFPMSPFVPSAKEERALIERPAMTSLWEHGFLRQAWILQISRSRTFGVPVAYLRD
jgi:hypothetical protein